MAEARALADEAEAAGVVHAVSLQGYHSPSARFVADLIAGGRLGQVESIAMITAGDPLGGSRIPQSLAYSSDRAAADNVLTIMVGHSLAVFDTIVGPVADVSAVAASFHDQISVAETGERVANDAPGQVAVLGRLAGGAVFSLTAQGGNAAAPDGFVVRVSGTDGTLSITPRDSGHYPGWADWRIMLRNNSGASRRAPRTQRILIDGFIRGACRQHRGALPRDRQRHPRGPRPPIPVSTPRCAITRHWPPSSGPRTPASARR